ncbi:MAG TPA: DUF2079 domain-containing protein, partial [Caldilineaceae bacterium]|nr:DUF2079 domain-containing protein [Caldilineaceae bacterium]
VLVYALLFGYLTITRYAAFESRALDMGNLDQAVWNTAHGRPFHFTNQPGAVNRLSLHVEPILLPIAGLYWLYTGPPTLLILQAIVVALGAWPLYLLARRRLGSGWMGLLFGLAFLLNPTIQAANWLEFHPLTLAPTLLIAAFACLVAGRSGWFACFAVLAASCKEEIALLVAMMGLYAFFILQRRRLGLVTFVLSVAWALVAVLFIQSRFADGNIHWGRYAYLGDNPGEMVRTLLTRPALVLAQLQSAQALRYLALLLLPVGFSALLVPEILLLALPSLAINLLADFPPMHEVYTLIYAAPIVPFVLIAALFAVGRVADFFAPRASTCQLAPLAPRNYTYGAAALLIAVCTLFAQHQFGYLPGGGNFHLYTVTDHHRRAQEILAQIPPEAKVSAQDRLNPHVSGRETVYIFPRIEDADTILLDVTGPAWPLHPNDVHSKVQELLANGFGIAAAADGYLLLRRGAVATSLPGEFYDAWRSTRTPEETPAFVFGDQLALLDAGVGTDSHGELVTQLTWEALKPIDQPLRFYVGYLDDAGNVLQDTQFYPPVAELWYPTSAWPVGQPILVQTLPWTLSADRFSLVVAVYTGEDPQAPAARLPVAGRSVRQVVVAGDTTARLGGYVRTERGGWREWSPPQPLPPGLTPAEFGGQVRLDHWLVPGERLRAGAAIPITLSWYALQQPALDFSVFVHLLDATGNKVAQLDWQPHDYLGPRPMTSWRSGQTVVDAQVLPIPPGLTPGVYHLVLGVYDWQSGDRLPVVGATAGADQTVELAELVIAE